VVFAFWGEKFHSLTVALTHTAACVGFELGFGGGWRECVVLRFYLFVFVWRGRLFYYIFLS
jgi:hypothetical protein